MYVVLIDSRQYVTVSSCQGASHLALLSSVQISASNIQVFPSSSGCCSVLILSVLVMASLVSPALLILLGLLVVLTWAGSPHHRHKRSGQSTPPFLFVPLNDMADIAQEILPESLIMWRTILMMLMFT